MASPLSAAKRLCEQSGWTLTNLQLQKMLYLAQMFWLGEHGDRLFNGQFEAWDYGPVQPDVYREVKVFGRDAIRSGFFGVGAVEDISRAAMLDSATAQLSKVSSGRLVAITHWKNGAWAKNYRPGVRGIPIPDRDIINEYNERFPAAPAVAPAANA